MATPLEEVTQFSDAREGSRTLLARLLLCEFKKAI